MGHRLNNVNKNLKQEWLLASSNKIQTHIKRLKNLHVVFCPNKQLHYEPFVCLDLNVNSTPVKWTLYLLFWGPCTDTYTYVSMRFSSLKRRQSNTNRHTLASVKAAFWNREGTITNLLQILFFIILSISSSSSFFIYFHISGIRLIFKLSC